MGLTFMENHLGFKKTLSQIQNLIFIPKYYDPEIKDRLKELSETHELLPFYELIDEAEIELKSGNEVGKISYGTGDIPFVRTSDISNWEIKTDPKQGISEQIYEKYAAKQDMKPGDILFVKDGTYLIGQTCFVTEKDLPCLYQSHITKIRVNSEEAINKYLLFLLLNSPIVKKQISSKQFTADIIDTVGNRIEEIILPIPKDQNIIENLINETEFIIDRRTELREIIRKIPLFAQSLIHDLKEDVSRELTNCEELGSRLSFKINRKDIKKEIFIPKYYDPNLENELESISNTHELMPLGNLVKNQIISWETGIEIGKMAYGTGDIPFIRTSDITNWELKTDPKKSVSEEIYESNKQDVKVNDIFLVRDGTYLVGTSCIITDEETKILFCGGIYKLRVLNPDYIDPYLLLALLNTPIVKRQIRSKQFTRDIIDTIGKRLFEIKLPIIKDLQTRQAISQKTKDVIRERIELRERARKVVLDSELLPEN